MMASISDFAISTRKISSNWKSDEKWMQLPICLRLELITSQSYWLDQLVNDDWLFLTAVAMKVYKSSLLLLFHFFFFFFFFYFDIWFFEKWKSKNTKNNLQWHRHQPLTSHDCGQKKKKTFSKPQQQKNHEKTQKQSLFERLMGSMARTGSNKGSLSHPHSHSHPNSNSGSTTLATTNNHGSSHSNGFHPDDREANCSTAIDSAAPDRFAASASQPLTSRCANILPDNLKKCPYFYTFLWLFAALTRWPMVQCWWNGL